MFTVKQLREMLRQPGKVEMDIMSEHDVFCICIEKSDLLKQISHMDANAPSPWYVSFTHEDGTRRLSIQTELDIEFEKEDAA